jgi:hypothetical protein
MTGYDVMVWPQHQTGEPDIVTTLPADSAAEAMVQVLRSVGLPAAAYVEVSTADGLLRWRWRLVVLLSGRRFLFLGPQEARFR